MSKRRVEVTSQRVAAIAGKVLRELHPTHKGAVSSYPADAKVFAGNVNGDLFRLPLTVVELAALAGSCLTQRSGIVHATARPKKAGRVRRK